MPEKSDSESGGRMSKQQILISGVGGQGILFITRMLAEAAIYKGLPVLTAETHGMAQRGGIVMSHLKIGGFTGPLIRPGKADILLLLHAGNLSGHLYYLNPGGIVVANAASGLETKQGKVFHIDASAMAKEMRQPKSANLILTGFAVAILDRAGGAPFCSADDLRVVMNQKLGGKEKMLQASIAAFNTGVLRGKEIQL
jgi:indolepyruvate ferredoxin oxidoreductase beta subunit